MQTNSRMYNPELDWASTPVITPGRERLEARAGPIKSLKVLEGGLRNWTFQLNHTRVLKIYRSNVGGGGIESALLKISWRSFRVPLVHAKGEDYLILEYVPHMPLRGTAQEGRAIGQALAEIHALTFPSAGFLDPQLRVTQLHADPIGGLFDYATNQLENSSHSQSRDLIRSLRQLMTVEGGKMRNLAHSNVLLHGDFKTSNLHWTSAGRPLVLDWEFAYAGPSLMDVGQLMRWKPPFDFVSAFADGYRGSGGYLPDGWQGCSDKFDLFNLAGLLGAAELNSQRAADVASRMAETLSGALA